jgi:threonine dehydrogenase-like Zn-dependent dehydrogenase
VGDRVAVYHIAGCRMCPDCRAGYFVSCTSPLRAAYGWQRDGGHADYLLAEEADCVVLPPELTFLDGACVACGFGTAYEALSRLSVSGKDAVLVTGLGPVGMAVGMLAKALGSPLVVGADIESQRGELAASLGTVDVAVDAASGALERVSDLTGGQGCEVGVDCSGSAAGRALALAGTRRRGRCALVGEGGNLTVNVSHDLIHRDLTVTGSWVTSIGRMTELVANLARWGLHPERIVSHRFKLDEAAAAYATADEGTAGKVAIVL